MANSLIPYSFIPGTKAMASEVNANFIALAKAVDEGKTFTTEAIEQFNTEFEERLDESLDSKLEVGLSNCKNISNCILEIPERINYEINSAGRIILKAGSEVYVSTNGTFEAVTLSSDTAEGAGGLWTTAHNRSLFVVYVPDTNSVQAHALDYTYAQATAPTTFLTGYALWYNTDTKVIKATIDSGANWQICSLPIMIGRPGESNIGWRGYVDNVFNGMGFIAKLTFVLPGVRALFADGRNSDGTLKNKEVTSKTVQMNNLTTQTSRLGQLEVSNNSLVLYGYGVTNYFEQETPPSGFGQHATWYNIRENELYSTSDSGVTWNKKYTIILPKLTKSSTTASISDIGMPYALKFADINDVLNRTDMPLLKSSNGYTKLPNGVLIQWGIRTAAGDSTGAAVTFPVPFSSTNYVVTVNPLVDTSEQNCVMGKTTTTFRVNSHGHGGSTFYNANLVNWLAIGY